MTPANTSAEKTKKVTGTLCFISNQNNYTKMLFPAISHTNNEKWR